MKNPGDRTGMSAKERRLKMNKFNNYLYKAACCLILVLLAAFISVGQALGKTGVSDVNIVNTPLPVREVVNPANEPFQAEISFSIPDGSSSETFTLAVVPAGKRLVVEYATILAEVPSGKMGARITTTAAGQYAAHHLVLTEQGPVYGTPTFVASQTMRVYADPGTGVTGIVVRSDTAGTFGGLMTISGYFVDVP
jgi:hypothetical protein